MHEFLTLEVLSSARFPLGSSTGVALSRDFCFDSQCLVVSLSHESSEIDLMNLPAASRAAALRVRCKKVLALRRMLRIGAPYPIFTERKLCLWLSMELQEAS